MIKQIKPLLLLLFVVVSLNSMAQDDSTAYQLQRVKINTLLAQRSAKFGQYEQSLNARTGIFGFQTKNDIKNSNEILRQIALNDNNIFRELKVLMEYKDVQVQQVQNTALINNDRIQRYMLAIKKLQDKNQQLKQEAEKQQGQTRIWQYVTAFLVLLLLSAVYILWMKIKKIRR
ncbi:hypothetical protein [Pedobacter nutrimenti]|uniref:Uncharacterized protein n=1 Tax=Pedobacter nutrimenti TaxID=1241337 RepID=A0A318UNV0_9SPHI|nr:hypothetical protein [Pedobacter nutrimenti]PYF76768.1 hypothetical protein B0O44_101241 [Pedobacter nutrimenti]